ncbi:hypothetical protein [Cyclobacterium xiamenense]|uniref:hypothetical protein n=1 Tax=Cyclobacterium xiamenense TaxID=1297121 RepID=UPI0035D0C7C7
MNLTFAMISMRSFIVLGLVATLFNACGPGDFERKSRYTLAVLDTLTIPFTGEIHAADFLNNRGVLYNYRSGTYLAFDSTGAVLTSNSLPTQGNNGLFYVNGIKLLPDGELFAHSIKGEIGLLDEDLRLREKRLMPFPNGVVDLKRNVQIMEKWNDELLLFIPGRGNKSPYAKGYYRDNYLLEKLNLVTGETEPFLRLSPESQYQQDLHFEPPTPLISRAGNRLYFAFNKEPLIHRYNLGAGGAWEESISLEAKSFAQIKGQVLPLGNDGSILSEGEITGLFAMENGFAVSYFEGIYKDSLPSAPAMPGRLLKWYSPGSGWSEPLALPKELLFLLNFEGPDKPFYLLLDPSYFPDQVNEVKILKLHVQPSS